jgi:hypothetical protein
VNAASLRFLSEFGDEHGVFETDAPSGESVRRWTDEVQQLQSLGYMRSGFRDSRRNSLNGVFGAFSVEQCAEALRFFERMNIGPLNVFDDLQFLCFGIGEVFDAGGNFGNSGAFRSAEPPRSGHDFKGPLTRRTKRGESTPCVRMLAASSSRRSSSNALRGLVGDSTNSLTGMFRYSLGESTVTGISDLFFAFAVMSVLLGKKDGSDGTVGFGDNPKLVARRRAIAAQKAKAFGEAESVFVLVFLGKFPPIPRDMPRQKLHRVLSRFFEGSQRAGCGDKLPQVKQRFSFGLLHEKFSCF